MTTDIIERATQDRYGNRTVPKMARQVETLRQVIRSEGTPDIQSAWDKVEEHIDYAYQQTSLAAEVQRLRAELTRRDEADKINAGRGK